MAPEQGLETGGRVAGKKVATAWIQKLSRPELERLAIEHHVPIEGTLDDVRRRFRSFLRDNPHIFAPSEDETDRSDGEAAAPPPLTIPTITVNHELSPHVPATRREVVIDAPEAARAIDQIRKWGCHFDGKDPIAFLERIEELREGYGLTQQQLLRGLPELLRGDSLLWYRNRRNTWRTWGQFLTDFRLQFLPRRYQARLKREAANRRQQPGETFIKYSTAILTLLRRAGERDEDEILDLVVENMDPEYRLYIRPHDGISLTELTERALEYEELVEQRRQRDGKTRLQTAAAEHYDRDSCCWRCKQRGHTRAECRRPPRRFCSQCGQDGVYTRDCHPRPGNAARTGETTATDRSPST